MTANLWDWQQEELCHALDPSRAFFWDPRTGKTREAVLHIYRLAAERSVRKVLVVAPQLVCQEVWEDELDALGFDHFNLYSGRLEDRRDLLKLLKDYSRTAVVLVNWDTLYLLVEDLIKWGPELVVADELHYAMSAGSKRSRALQRLGKLAKYRRGLTGTPTPKHYIDLYSQYKFLDPSIFGTSKAKFLDRYVDLDFWGRPARYKNLPELRSKMFSIASRVDRGKVWGDRPPQEITRRIELPAVARRLYDNLVTELVGKYGGLEIDATHKLTQLIRCQQLSAGFVADNGVVKWVHTAKIDAAIEELRDLLDSGQKVVIFYHFHPEGLAYEAAIIKEFGASSVARIGGDTPPASRHTFQERFRSTADDAPSIMLMQDSLGVGISLKSASYAIRTSYPLSFDHFKQSNDRIYEPGKPLTYINLHAPDTVDEFARDVVTTKHTASYLLLDVGFENALRGNLYVPEKATRTA